MKRNTVRIVLTLLITGVSLLASVSCGNDTDQTGQTEPTGAKGVIHVDYENGYDNITDLTADSALIVVGSVESNNEVVPDEATHGQIYNTRSVFRVEEVLKGEAAEEITVSQTGAIGRAEVEDDPVFRLGESYILFLRQDNTGIYYPLSGPRGRYKIIDGRVYSMNRALRGTPGIGVHEGLDIWGVELDAFIKDVTEEVNASQRAALA